MLDFKIYWDSENNKWMIKTLNNHDPHIQEIKEVYLKAMFNTFWYFGRNKRIGKELELLIENKIDFIFSEHDLLNIIKYLYFRKYNYATGNFFIDYYKSIDNENATYEILKLSEDY